MSFEMSQDAHLSPLLPPEYQEGELPHAAEYDEFVKARLQLSVGAAAARLSSILGLEADATHELIRSSLDKPVATQLSLRTLFDSIPNYNGSDLHLDNKPVAAVIDLDEHRHKHTEHEAKPNSEGGFTALKHFELSSPIEVRRARKSIERIPESIQDISTKERDEMCREIISYLRSVPDTETLQDRRLQSSLHALREACHTKIIQLSEPAINYWKRKYALRGSDEREEFDAIIHQSVVLASERFDHRYQNFFATFVDRTISGNLKRHIRDKLIRASGIPRSQTELVSNLKKFMETTGKDFDSAVAELGADPDFAKEAYENVQNFKATTSLDIPEVGMRISGENSLSVSPEDQVTTRILSDELQDMLTSLNLDKRSILVMYHRYGITASSDGTFYYDLHFEKLSTTVIAKTLGLSQSYVSRIAVDMLKKLKEGIETTNEIEDDFSTSIITHDEESSYPPSESPASSTTKTPDNVQPHKTRKRSDTPSTPLSSSTQRYLLEIGRYPLLDAAREVELGSIIQEGLAAAGRLSELSSDYSLEERQQDMRLVQLGQEAKKDFIQSNLRLVVSVAKRYRTKAGENFELLDLIQEGNLGLEHAVDKFDPEKGFKFSTYATFWIKQSINRGIGRTADIIRIPSDEMRADVKRYWANRDESDASLEQLFGWDPDYMAEIKELSLVYYVTSSDTPIGDDSATLGDFLSDPRDSGEYDSVNRGIMEQDLISTLESILTDREMDFIRMRMGLNSSGERFSYREVGLEFGITAEAARRFIKRSISKLRSPEYQDVMEPYKILLED